MNRDPANTRASGRLLGALLPALLLSACMLGPDYKRPDMAYPSSFRSQIATTQSESFADLPWWTIYKDPSLQALINEGLANNQDLQVAIARIEQARAQVQVIESANKPQIGYEASARGEKAVLQDQNGVGSGTFAAFEGLLSAAWEIDLWGRIRHATDAGRANLLAQEDVRRGVILTLVSDIAADYFRLLELDQELAIAEESARTYKSTLDMFSLRYSAGKDSKLPVERARAAYDSANANIHDLKRRISQQENAISTLLGAFPRSIARGHRLPDQILPPTPVGATTELMRRRPDILVAEQHMIGANAEIGVAVANFYPRIGLSTFFGGAGINFKDVWSGFGVWNLAAQLAGPIYSGGRLEATYHERQAFWDETVAQYRQTVLVAFRETSDALVAQQTLAPQRVSLESQVEALQESADLAMLRYRSGRASYFEVLEAQQQLFPAARELAQNQRDQLVATVNLYKALGGGWFAVEQQQQHPQTVNAAPSNPTAADASAAKAPTADAVPKKAPTAEAATAKAPTPGGG